MSAFATQQELDAYVERLRRSTDEGLIRVLTEAAGWRAVAVYQNSRDLAGNSEEKMHLISAEILRRIRQHVAAVRGLGFQMMMEKQINPGPPCIHDPACCGPIPCTLCVADIQLREHKRIHPFDLYGLLNTAEVTDVFKRGREKVTLAVEGEKPYSYWATVIEVNGELYTETTTVEPNTAGGIAMMLILKANTPKMPKATVSYSELEIHPPVPCAFQMSLPARQEGTGAIYCNRNYGHTGAHSHTAQFIPAPEVRPVLNILATCPACTAPLILHERDAGWITSLDAVRGEYHLAGTVKEERRRRWTIWFVLLAGMVFGAAVTALVLLTPTP